MKNNSLLILLVAVIVFGVLCAIVAGIALSFYNSDLSSLNTPQTDPLIAPGESDASTKPSELEPHPSEDSTSLLESANMKVLYLAELMQEYQLCQNHVTIFMATVTDLEANPSLQQNREYLDTLKANLEQIDSSCSNLGSEDNIPEEFTELNHELLLVNENVTVFTDNYIKWIDDHKVEYILAGNEAFSAVSVHMQKANALLQAALAP